MQRPAGFFVPKKYLGARGDVFSVCFPISLYPHEAGETTSSSRPLFKDEDFKKEIKVALGRTSRGRVRIKAWLKVWMKVWRPSQKIKQK